MNSRKNGNSILELPALLFISFVIVGFPLIGLATLSYRGAVLQAIVKSACTSASRAHSFHDAQARAASIIKTGCGDSNGVAFDNYQISIVTENLTSAKQSESFSTLNPEAIDTQNNLYFVKVNASGSVSPIVPLGHQLSSAKIPGLTAPYALTASCQLFFERPKGLAY